MGLQEVKSAIEEVCSTVDGIGTVYPRYLASYVLSDFQRYFAEDGMVNVLMFNPVGRTTEKREDSSSVIKRKFSFDFFISRSDDDNTSELFDNLCEGICEAVNDNRTLKGTIGRHEGMQMKKVADVQFGSVLCHFARFELTTYEANF